MGDAIRSPIDTHRYLPKRKLRKKYLNKGNSLSLFPGVEEYPQELLFLDIKSKELGRNFGRDGDNSGEELLKEGELLTMTSTLKADETWESAAEIASLEGKVPQSSFVSCLYLLPNLASWCRDIVCVPFATVSTLTFESGGWSAGTISCSPCVYPTKEAS